MVTIGYLVNSRSAQTTLPQKERAGKEGGKKEEGEKRGKGEPDFKKKRQSME